jgi:hypothetical protein
MFAGKIYPVLLIATPKRSFASSTALLAKPTIMIDGKPFDNCILQQPVCSQNLNL